MEAVDLRTLRGTVAVSFDERSSAVGSPLEFEQEVAVSIPGTGQFGFFNFSLI